MASRRKMEVPHFLCVRKLFFYWCMPMFSIRNGKSKFISYYIMSRIQKMSADVEEELSDMTHKLVNVCCTWKWWYIGYCVFSKVIASAWTWHLSLWGIHTNSTKYSTAAWVEVSRCRNILYCISTLCKLFFCRFQICSYPVPAGTFKFTKWRFVELQI